ncbi:MAG: DUF6290 family protein [Rickettsiales bacterium]
MLTVRLGEEMEARLNELAATTKQSKSAIIKDALREHLEDMEDLRDALASLNDPNDKWLTSEQIKKELRFED